VGYVGFVVDKVVVGQVFLCHYHSTNAPYPSSYSYWSYEKEALVKPWNFVAMGCSFEKYRCFMVLQSVHIMCYTLRTLKEYVTVHPVCFRVTV
jgi:hypothetical protein